MTEAYYCHPCKYRITLPAELENESQLELVNLSRANRNIDTMAAIRMKYGLDLRDAKFIARHISKRKDHCADCGNKLLEDGITHCPFCSGLNFSW